MKEKKLKDAKITIRIEADIRDILEKLAETEDKSISHFIRSELKKIANNSKNK
jgi:uncharacterized protein (DUF1778 family)